MCSPRLFCASAVQRLQFECYLAPTSSPGPFVILGRRRKGPGDEVGLAQGICLKAYQGTSVRDGSDIGVGDRGQGGCSPPNFGKICKIRHNRAENRPENQPKMSGKIFNKTGVVKSVYKQRPLLCEKHSVTTFVLKGAVARE